MMSRSSSYNRSKRQRSTTMTVLLAMLATLTHAAAAQTLKHPAADNTPHSDDHILEHGHAVLIYDDLTGEFKAQALSQAAVGCSTKSSLFVAAGLVSLEFVRANNHFWAYELLLKFMAQWKVPTRSLLIIALVGASTITVVSCLNLWHLLGAGLGLGA